MVYVKGFSLKTQTNETKTQPNKPNSNIKLKT